ncbi:hypothetical protein EV715DRAFT_268348 [Schizophyllum commune]
MSASLTAAIPVSPGIDPANSSPMDESAATLGLQKTPIVSTIARSSSDAKRKERAPSAPSGVGSASQQALIDALQAKIDELERERMNSKVRVVNPQSICPDDLLRDNFRLQQEVAHLKAAAVVGVDSSAAPITCKKCGEIGAHLSQLSQQIQEYQAVLLRHEGDYINLKERHDVLLDGSKALSRTNFALEKANSSQAERIAQLEKRDLRAKATIVNLMRISQEHDRAQQQMQDCAAAMTAEMSEWLASDLADLRSGRLLSRKS